MTRPQINRHYVREAMRLPDYGDECPRCGGYLATRDDGSQRCASGGPGHGCGFDTRKLETHPFTGETVLRIGDSLDDMTTIADK